MSVISFGDDAADSLSAPVVWLSDPAMEGELYEIASMQQAAGLSRARGTVPDETTILNFRHLLEQHGLAREIFDTVNAHVLPELDVYVLPIEPEDLRHDLCQVGIASLSGVAFGPPLPANQTSLRAY